MTIGEKIRHIRLSKKMSQTMVTIRCGFSSRNLSRIETGKGLPDLSTLEKLAKAFNMTPGQILDYGETPVNSDDNILPPKDRELVDKFKSLPFERQKQVLELIDLFNTAGGVPGCDK